MMVESPVLFKLNLELDEHVLTVTILVSLAVMAVPEAERNSILEPEGIENTTVVAPTSADATTALVPSTVMSELLTLKTASVVSVTSLYAAKASDGTRSASVAVEAKNFFMRIR